MPDRGAFPRINKLLVIFVAFLVLPLALAAASKPLLIYSIDVEGGQSTLFVSPSGQSFLVDTGWPDHNSRDAKRIMAAAKDAGIHQIDYLVITHYHDDHVGGMANLAALIPIRNFIDHGDPVQRYRTPELYQAYVKAAAEGHRTLAKPGMRIPIQGINVTVLTAAGQVIDHPLPGGGEANKYCPATTQPARDRSENAMSVGTLISYGKFRMIDLGDLPSWPAEYDLVCPTNKIGHVSVYLTTQHGYAESGAPFIVDALRPIVIIANNGQHKGGTTKALQTVDQSPGLEGFWDLHFSDSAEKSLNTKPEFIANLTDNPADADNPDHGYWIKVTAHSNGTFTVTNQRNNESKTYQPRK